MKMAGDRIRLRKSIDQAKAGAFSEAIDLFESKEFNKSDPEAISYYALSIATVDGKLRKAAKLCHEAWKLDRNNPVIYHNLGKIYILAGRKKEALKVLEKGLQKPGGKDAGIATLINSMGRRRRPVLSMFPRESRTNKFLGSITAKFHKGN